jgi:hypothetical protein
VLVDHRGGDMLVWEEEVESVLLFKAYLENIV